MESAVEVKRKRFYSGRLLWLIFGMTWGSFSYGYAQSIIATTIGDYP